MRQRPQIMIKNVFLLNMFSIAICCSGISQKPPETVSEYEKKYNRQIVKEYLYGVYIPRDLTDAFIQLNKKMDADAKTKYRSIPEELVTEKLFFSFGRWIIHNWNFYEGSRLSHYIKSMGIHHPEDMAGFIMIAYHRNLNRKSLNIKELIQLFHDKQEKAKEQLLKKGEILYEETRQRTLPDTLKNN